VLVWGIHGWFGGWFFDNGIRIIYSVPGMVLATIFVSLPFVVREVVPVLRAIGTEQEEAAEVLGVSLRTLRRRWQDAKLRLLGGVSDGRAQPGDAR